MRRMERTSTSAIAQALTDAIVERRVQPGAKLVEQKLAEHFGVSRTLVRQALHQLAQQRLVTLSPARGAFVATLSAQEARQVFVVRRMLEPQMARAFTEQATPAQIALLRAHLAQEQTAVADRDAAGRTRLLADFHALLAELMGNAVLAQVLQDLLARSAIAALSFQSAHAASHSSDEHVALVDAIEAGDAERAAQLMTGHLDHVEAHLRLDRPAPTHDLPAALARHTH